MLIGIVNSKGGVGKSTLAVHAAVWLHEQDLRVAAIDADPQASLTRWLSEAAPEIPVSSYTQAAQIYGDGPALARTYDAVVVDGPAALNVEIATIIGIADLCLMPIGPSMLDLWASYRTARLIYQVRFSPKRRGLPHAYTVLNRVQRNTRLGRMAETAVEKYGFEVAGTVLHHLSAYAEAGGAGTVVWRLGRRARTAADEMRALLAETLGGVIGATAEADAPTSATAPAEAGGTQADALPVAANTPRSIPS